MDLIKLLNKRLKGIKYKFKTCKYNPDVVHVTKEVNKTSSISINGKQAIDKFNLKQQTYEKCN